MDLAVLRFVAVAEAVSYLALLAAVVAKRAFGHPEGVSVVGPIHGLVFLAYFVAVVFARDEQGWTGRQPLAALAASVVPFGGVWVERRLERDAATLTSEPPPPFSPPSP